MELNNQMLSLLFVLFLSTHIDCTRTKRMFALCPPHFVRIGNECYFISQNRVNWLDAHFECKDKNSRLAEPFKQEDRFLRKYLNHITGLRPDDLWIGARFNWELNKWQWGTNGKYLTYQSFSQMSAGNKDLKFHCAILKPNLKYRWSASSCEIEHQYICQHRMPYVNERNRQKIYNKWNETYPHEMANEIEIVLSEDDLLRRRKTQQRSHQRLHHNRQIKHEQNERRKNDIRSNYLHGRNQPQNALQKTHGGNKRGRNGNVNRKFDLNRAGGIRQTIQFNHTNNWHRTRMSHPKMTHDQRWQKQKWNTKLRTTTTNSPWRIFNLSTIGTTTTTTPMPTTTTPIPTTTTPMPTTTTPMPTTTTPSTTTTSTTMRTTITTSTTTPPPPPTTKWVSNDVFSDDEEMQRQYEQRLYEEEQRKNQEYLDKLRRIEEERLQNEERIRANHLKEMEQRQQKLLEEEQHQKELDELQKQKREQEAERQRQNEINKMIYETEQQNRQAEIRQREQQAHHDEHAIQTNEVLDDTNISSSTTISPIEKKRLRNKKLHERLSKLSIEEQNLFFQRRAEKHKKRQVVHGTAVTPEPQ